MSEDEFLYRVSVDTSGVTEGCDEAETKISTTARTSIRTIGMITRELRWALSVAEDLGINIDTNAKKALTVISTTTTGLSSAITICQRLNTALQTCHVTARGLLTTLGVIGGILVTIEQFIEGYNKYGILGGFGQISGATRLAEQFGVPEGALREVYQPTGGATSTTGATTTTSTTTAEELAEQEDVRQKHKEQA